MARRCGAKRICKSKCSKHLIVGAIFDVAIRKKWHAAVARSAFSTQTAQNTTIADRFWMFRSQKLHAAVAISTFANENVKKNDGYGPLVELQMWKNRTAAF